MLYRNLFAQNAQIFTPLVASQIGLNAQDASTPYASASRKTLRTAAQCPVCLSEYAATSLRGRPVSPLSDPQKAKCVIEEAMDCCLWPSLDPSKKKQLLQLLLSGLTWLEAFGVIFEESQHAAVAH